MLLGGDVETNPGPRQANQGIATENANKLYEVAGTRYREKDLDTVLEGDVFSEDNPLVQSVINSANLPYILDYFQRISLFALAAGKSVILTAPCGSGKFNILSLATNLLRIQHNKPDGVALVVLPLTVIMREVQSSNPDVAYITMAGDVVGDDGENINMSDSLEALLSGKYKMILGLCVRKYNY